MPNPIYPDHNATTPVAYVREGTPIRNVLSGVGGVGLPLRPRRSQRGTRGYGAECSPSQWRCSLINGVVTRLYHEPIDAGHDLGNFTSFLLVYALRYLALQLSGDIPRDTGVAIASLDADKILS